MSDKPVKDETETNFVDDPINEKMTADEERLLDDLGVVGQAQVVVRAEQQHRPPVQHHARSLGTADRPHGGKLRPPPDAIPD